MILFICHRKYNLLVQFTIKLFNNLHLEVYSIAHLIKIYLAIKII